MCVDLGILNFLRCAIFADDHTPQAEQSVADTQIHYTCRTRKLQQKTTEMDKKNNPMQTLLPISNHTKSTELAK